MKIISLGDTCCVAWQKPKGEYYPFDWIKVPKFSTINKLIQNDFATFFSDLKFIETSTKFPLNSDDHSAFSDWKQQVTHIYSNSDITFTHDFTEDNGIEQVKEKYQRRVDRFWKTVQTEEILFVRHQLKINEIDSMDLEVFISIMDRINRNYRLKIIMHNPKNRPLALRNNDPRVQIINDTNAFKDWTRPTVDWSAIFELYYR